VYNSLPSIANLTSSWFHSRMSRAIYEVKSVLIKQKLNMRLVQINLFRDCYGRRSRAS
jgi:hypothetical protein